jgi:transcriptional regulator of nitric oxide reductase
MTYVTRTTLLVDRGGKTITVAEASEVKKSDFDKAVWEKLVADGSVAEVAVSAGSSSREEELQAQVDELKAQLAAVSGAAKAETSPAKPTVPTATPAKP